MERSFNLGAEYEALIDHAVQAGDYASGEDVVRESLRLLQERKDARRQLNESIREGIAAADRGELVDLHEAFDQLDAYIEQLGLNNHR